MTSRSAAHYRTMGSGCLNAAIENGALGAGAAGARVRALAHRSVGGRATYSRIRLSLR